MSRFKKPVDIGDVIYRDRHYSIRLGAVRGGEHRGVPCYLIVNEITGLIEGEMSVLHLAVNLLKDLNEALSQVLSEEDDFAGEVMGRLNS